MGDVQPFGTNFKAAKGSARLAAQERKDARKRLKAKAQHQAKLAEHKRQQAIRLAVYQRDKGRCRVCGIETTIEGNLYAMAHCHHVVYRSAGGSDEPPNRCILCHDCHADEHASRIQITGDGNVTLQVVIFDRHQQIAAVKESPCPTL